MARRPVLLSSILCVLVLAAVAVFWKWPAAGPEPISSAVEVTQKPPEPAPAPVREAPLPVPPEEQQEPAPEPVLEPEEPGPLAVAGIVVDAEDGAPVADARIYVRRHDPDGILAMLNEEPWFEESLSDKEGHFSVNVPRPGVKYVVSAVASGYHMEGAVRLVPEEGVDDVVLRLVTLCTVSGRVTNAQGQPVANVVVGAAHGWGEPPEPDTRSDCAPSDFSEPTGPDGTFTIKDLKRGYCVLSAKPESSPMMETLGATPDDMPLVIKLAAGEKREGVELKLDGGTSQYVIEGVVQSQQGGPIRGAEVWSGMAYDRKLGWTGASSNLTRIRGVASSVTDERGRFRIDSVNKGGGVDADGTFSKLPVYVHCAAEGFEPAYVPDVPLGTKNVIVTLLPRSRGRISGVVLDRGTRRPVAAAQVMIWQVRTEWGDRHQTGSNDQGVSAGENGQFVFEDVPAGDVTLQVAHPEYGVSLHRAGIRVAPNRTKQVELLLESPGTLDIEALVTGNLAGNESARRCYLSLFADDVMNVEDVRPWDYSYGACDYRDPGQPGGAPTNVCQVFAHAAERQSGQDGWREIEAGHWKGTLRLPPGNYTVTVRCGVTYRLAKKAAIAKGQTVPLRFHFGGTAAIRGTVAGLPGEEPRSIVILTSPSDADILPDAAPLSGDFFASLFMEASDMAAVCHPYRSEFGFNSLPSGNYTLTTYTLDPQTGDMRLTARDELAVADGQEREIQLP